MINVILANANQTGLELGQVIKKCWWDMMKASFGLFLWGAIYIAIPVALLIAIAGAVTNVAHATDNVKAQCVKIAHGIKVCEFEMPSGKECVMSVTYGMGGKTSLECDFKDD